LWLVAAGSGQELLVNGDFEQPLENGWIVDTGEYGYKTISRDVGYQPDPDYEALDSIYAGNGYSKLGQTVDVPGPSLLLTFSASFAVGGTSSSCWPVASVVVIYKDVADAVLGQTRFYYHNEYCTWVPSSTMSLHEVTNPDWTQYSLDVADELAQNLPGVNPGDINRVEVALYDTTAGG
jgi:hypothetical protein